MQEFGRGQSVKAKSHSIQIPALVCGGDSVADESMIRRKQREKDVRNEGLQLLSRPLGYLLFCSMRRGVGPLLE